MLKQIPLILAALIFTVTAIVFSLLPESNRGFQEQQKIEQPAEIYGEFQAAPPQQSKIDGRPFNTPTSDAPLPGGEEKQCEACRVEFYQGLTPDPPPGREENQGSVEAGINTGAGGKTDAAKSPAGAIYQSQPPAERQHSDTGQTRRPPWLAAYAGGSEEAGPRLTPALPAPAQASCAQDRLNFLLLGRPGDGNQDPLLIMVVTIFPESHARLLSIDPALITTGPGGSSSFWEISERRNHYATLVRRVEAISSKEISFYIELNLHGAAEMVDLIGGISPGGAGTEKIGGAEAIYLLLESTDLTRREKEQLIISILERCNDLEMTRIGFALLKLGYRSIRTGLSLADLIELRRISGKIYSTSISYHELR